VLNAGEIKRRLAAMRLAHFCLFRKISTDRTESLPEPPDFWQPGWVRRAETLSIGMVVENPIGADGA
jgi:hypothetical protein